MVRVSAGEPARAPALAPIPDQVVEAGEPFGFSLVVEDPGMPEAKLQFKLAPGAPKGMKIDPLAGRIDWTLPEDEAAGTYPVTVLATSTAEGGLSATRTFAIEVKARPDAGPKLAVPDEPSQTAVLAEVKELFKEEYRDSKPHARLALAARLIRHAQESQGQAAESYVMLSEARRLAEQSNDCLLALSAIDELAGSFEVDAVKMKAEVLEQVARQARSPAAALLIAHLTFALGEEALDTDAYESVSALYRQVELAVRKAGGAEQAEAVKRQLEQMGQRRRLWESSQVAAATLKGRPDDPQANLALGRFHGLAKEDWNKALPLLAKGSDDKLRESAGRLVADLTDLGGQTALADAWWELAEMQKGDAGVKLLLLSAAQYWYQQALPRLAGLERMRVERRLQADKAEPRQEAVQPYQVALNGLGGLSALPPKKVSGAVAPTGGFATFGGKGGIEYVQVPAPSYVHEFELTFAAPGGSMTLNYGERREGARISFAWETDQKKYRCRLSTYRGGWTFWSGTRHYPPGQALRFTLCVNASRQTLCQDDSPIMSTAAHPADLRLRLSTGDGTAAVISRCLFRPWTELDAERARFSKPPTRIDCDWSATAVRLHERNLGLADRPLTNDAKPFVIATTGSPMVWIPPGSFKRPHSKQRNQATEVSISNGFWIAQYEVTQGEWTALGGVNTSRVVGSPFLPVDAVS
ncbi:MAG: SUMF1/EgtB/PvdO family nonheme iron enzyme, partial [Planctomycetes bacterium]|nr:SUMF1/EgtB/PvdO family nonheme iron enzyme [Planctomycetota bacterium]